MGKPLTCDFQNAHDTTSKQLAKLTVGYFFFFFNLNYKCLYSKWEAPVLFWIINTQSSEVLIYAAGEVVLNTINKKKRTFQKLLHLSDLQRSSAGPCQAPASCDSCSTWRHCCSDRHGGRRLVDSMASFTRAQAPAHRPSVGSPFPHLFSCPPFSLRPHNP